MMMIDWCNVVVIVIYYNVQVSSDCRYLLTSVVFEAGGEMFTYTGKTVIDPGYTAIMPWHSIPPEEDLPSSCKAGQVCTVKEVRRIFRSCDLYAARLCISTTVSNRSSLSRRRLCCNVILFSTLLVHFSTPSSYFFTHLQCLDTAAVKRMSW